MENNNLREFKQQMSSVEQDSARSIPKGSLSLLKKKLSQSKDSIQPLISNETLNSEITCPEIKTKPISNAIDPKVLALQLPTHRKCLIWRCTGCNFECIPIRRESRCLCGHRMKEHNSDDFRCVSSRCLCRQFFFIVAEGSWTLKCRCKHKHIEHDPSNPSHPCLKCKGGTCLRFDSPWVCNCGHPWGYHTQLIEERQLGQEGAQLGDLYQEEQPSSAFSTFSSLSSSLPPPTRESNQTNDYSQETDIIGAEESEINRNRSRMKAIDGGKEPRGGNTNERESLLNQMRRERENDSKGISDRPISLSTSSASSSLSSSSSIASSSTASSSRRKYFAVRQDGLLAKEFNG